MVEKKIGPANIVEQNWLRLSDLSGEVKRVALYLNPVIVDFFNHEDFDPKETREDLIRCAKKLIDEAEWWTQEEYFEARNKEWLRIKKLEEESDL